MPSPCRHSRLRCRRAKNCIAFRATLRSASTRRVDDTTSSKRNLCWLTQPLARCRLVAAPRCFPLSPSFPLLTAISTNHLLPRRRLTVICHARVSCCFAGGWTRRGLPALGVESVHAQPRPSSAHTDPPALEIDFAWVAAFRKYRRFTPTSPHRPQSCSRRSTSAQQQDWELN